MPSPDSKTVLIAFAAGVALALLTVIAVRPLFDSEPPAPIVPIEVGGDAREDTETKKDKRKRGGRPGVDAADDGDVEPPAGSPPPTPAFDRAPAPRPESNKPEPKPPSAPAPAPAAPPPPAAGDDDDDGGDGDDAGGDTDD